MCMASLDDEDITHKPVSFNITTFPDKKNTNPNLTAGTVYIYKIWTVGADDGINGFVSPPISGWYPVTI